MAPPPVPLCPAKLSQPLPAGLRRWSWLLRIPLWLLVQQRRGVVLDRPPAELAAGITTLSEDPERRRQLAAAALDASRHYNSQCGSLVEEWLELAGLIDKSVGSALLLAQRLHAP